MKIEAFLDRAKQAGVTLKIDEGRLRAYGDRQALDLMVDELHENKQALLEHFRKIKQSPVFRHLEIFAQRTQQFTAEGLTHTDSEELAQRLALRDRDLDDRKVCLECANLSGHGQTWRCGNWHTAGISIRARDNQLPASFVAQLQRCAGFTTLNTERSTS